MGINNQEHKEDRRTRIFVPLKHTLHYSRLGVPELHTPVLGPTDDPLAIVADGDAKHVVLVSSEVHCALARPVGHAALLSWAGGRSTVLAEAAVTRTGQQGLHVPVLERLVERTTDKAATVGSERYAVHTVSVTLETFDESSGVDIPDANDSV